ncbi:MAG: amidohydrolase/deacetylase family metallohydrolase [Planctomycetes bacterium]|nr:amidohydrolase/deacetylase family metallohydrolase [Planctomycetota bacterium]
MPGNYLLKNVRPVAFPGHDGTATLDVQAADGIITAAGAGLRPESGAAVTDFAGAFLSPAWVDMHTHVYWGGCDIGVLPRIIGIATGVPILVDAGSAGEAIFHGFRELIIKSARERILPFLNVGSIGLVATNRIPEIRALGDIDPGLVMKTVEENRGLIAGLKVRMLKNVDLAPDILPLKMGKKLSRVLKLPVMVHFGPGLPLVEEVLDLLEPGDILSHCFRGNPASGISDDECASAAARRALERGVALDIGHGAGSFSYRVGRKCVDLGILPTTIGSDLHDWDINGPVWDLSIVMAKMLAIGLSFARTVDGVTAAPRRLLRLEEAKLQPGARADFTLFTVEDADLELPDSYNEFARITRRFMPKAVLWEGELSEASSRYGEKTANARQVEWKKSVF